MARQTLIAIRRDTAANWTSANPTLAAGEYGLETDTMRVKLGDGSTAWTSLEYHNYLSSLKDVNLSSLQDGQILEWDSTTSKWINVTQSAGHTQNTDTGTTSTTFDIDSDTTGVRLKNSSGELQIRNLADNAYGDMRVKNLIVEGTTTTIHSEDVTIDDNTIILNSNVTGAPSDNGGIEIERGTSTNASLIWDESADVWKCGLVGSESAIAAATHNHSGIYIAVVGTATAGNFPVLTAGGELANSAYGPSSFAASSHNHDSAYVNLPAGTEQGDVLYHSGSAFAVLHHDSANKVFLCGGHGANPSWGDIDGGSA